MFIAKSGMFRLRYDSDGVEFAHASFIFYKHSIPLGWTSLFKMILCKLDKTLPVVVGDVVHAGADMVADMIHNG